MAGASVISAFSAEHVSRITGLTPRQLRYWDGIGFFRPAYEHVGEGIKAIKVYSFRDVVGLRVVSVLHNEHKLSVQYLRKVAQELLNRSDSPWSSLTLAVCKGEVTIIDRAAGRGHGLFSGQYVLVPIIDQIRHVRRAAANLSKRRADQVGLVEKHRNVAHNAPVFAGTRVAVRAVELFLDAGYSVDAILGEYPSLERADIEAVIRERRSQLAA